MPKRDDYLLLADIHEAGMKIQRYTAGFSFETFLEDERTIDAVIRNFEVIGEAARNFSALFRQQHTSIPWTKIISYRNLLIHEYFGCEPKSCLEYYYGRSAVVDEGHCVDWSKTGMN